MSQDRYGLALGTRSAAAAEAYGEALDLLLSGWPGALPGFERALAADPGFAAARIARARVLQLGAQPAARAALEECAALPGLTAREASQARLFLLLADGAMPAALAAVRAHVAEWPRDALVAATAANQTGLIAVSGRPAREQELVEFLAALAPHYGDDWWFNGHYGMALSEAGRQAEAWPLLEASLRARPRNASLAHSIAHYHYENGEHDAAVAFLRGWLADYPRKGGLHGHLSWHLAVVRLQQGAPEEGYRLFEESFAAEDSASPAMVRAFDSCSFLWRAELAGYPRDHARWQRVHEFCHRAFPRPSLAYVDWHIALADAAAGAPEPRAAELERIAAEGRAPWGPGLAVAARGFAAFERGDHAAAIAALAPLLGGRSRLGGSRAQLDLLEFTLLRAYLASGRLDEARTLVASRRPGPHGIPVAGVERLAA
jgi:tetratricopeptide (TPR) repeat protein